MIFSMKKIYITLLLLTVALVVAPLAKQTPPAPQANELVNQDKPVVPPVVAETASKEDDNGVSGFSASLGPLGNLGAPELAALIILALLAGFVLVRRLSDRKKSPLPQSSSAGPQASQVPQTSQSSPQSQPTLLQEGRQELSEKEAWK